MVQFNTKDNEILVKLVFYGPSLSGKTTNLQKLHEIMDPTQRTDLFSVNTMEDRTLFFDLLPLDLGYVYGNSIKLQIYTVPGQVHYDSTRRIVLSGADGVVFVADSDASKIQDNIQSINNLFHNLQANRLNIKEVPLVIQYNKRDLPNAAPLELLNQKLNFRNAPFFEAVAFRGEGVLETFLETVKQTVRHIFEKYQLSKNIKNVDSVIEKLETSLIASAQKNKALRKDKPPQGEAPALPNPGGSGGAAAGRTVLKYTHNVDRDDAEAQDQLLKKAITSNMETARLYTELKKSQDQLVKKNEELAALNKQVEKTNADNLKMRRFLESLVNFAGEAIITFNELWVTQNWNQSAEELFSYKREEVLGQNINLLFPSEAMTDLNRVLNYVNQGKVVRGFETKLRNKSAQTLPVNITFSPIKNQNDTIIAFTAIIRDLSFMSKMNQQLNALQRYESVSNLVPELLNQIRLNVASLPKDLNHMMHLVSDLIGGGGGQVESLNLNQVIHAIHKLVEPTLNHAGIDWYMQLFPTLPELQLNDQHMTQALLNLILNGLDSLEGVELGKLTVGTHANASEILVQIIDNGLGMAHDELDRAQEPVFDPKKSIKSLRLNATRDLIKKAGGTLRIDSSPGKGTKVTLRFPL